MGTTHLSKKTPARSKKTASGPSSGLGQEGLLQYLTGKLPSGANAAQIAEKLSHLIGRLAAAQGEAPAGARQSPSGIAQTLLSMGGSDTVNVGEIAKPAGKRNTGDLEAHANRMLRQATALSAGAFAPDNAISVVKCRFRDNALKPKTVTDVKLAVNIAEHELVGPDAYASIAAQYLIDNALLDDLDSAHFDLSKLREGIARSEGLEKTRASGFSLAHNALVALLDRAKLDYQCIENSRDGRELVISEYDDSDPANLPDERYALRLCYFDEDQLAEARAAHDVQLASFESEAQLLWDLIEVNYQDSKPIFKVNDFEDLAKKNKGRIRDLLKRKNAAPAQEIIKEPIAVRFARMHERIKNMYEFLYPVERRLMEDRLAWLERENARLDFMVNPRHLRPGLLVDVEITSIKRRKATLGPLAAALGDFLRGVYGCFQVHI